MQHLRLGAPYWPPAAYLTSICLSVVSSSLQPSLWSALVEPRSDVCRDANCRLGTPTYRSLITSPWSLTSTPATRPPAPRSTTLLPPRPPPRSLHGGLLLLLLLQGAPQPPPSSPRFPGSSWSSPSPLP